MAYVDKINKENVDYDIQDSKAARSVDGTTASHVEEANQIYTTSGVAQTEYFIYRTTAGDASINTGPASIVKLIGHTEQTGHTDEILVSSPSFANAGTTMTLNKSTFKTVVSESGTYSFYYDGAWKLSNEEVSLATYGITVTGAVAVGDNITVNYTKLEIGTLTTATPTAFVATGYNQYDATAGYAHVIGNNQYRIAGTYTSLGFTTTIGGTTTAVTVTDGKFTPTEDGYIYVTGASGDILIALVWSGIRDSDPFEAYETDTIAIPTADASATSLPTASYGMPSVGDVADELSFSEKKYYQRIGHYTYSAENLATVEALGVAYIWDNSDIFYVLDDTVEYTLASTVDGTYIANDFGTEEFTGTSATVGVSLYYGDNLVDKLRNLADIQTIGAGLTLNNGELSSGGGSGSSVKVLTSADYNWNTTSWNDTTTPFDSVALWKLEPGWYTKNDSSVKGWFSNSESMVIGDVTMVTKKYTFGVMTFTFNGGLANQGFSYGKVRSTSDQGYRNSGGECQLAKVVDSTSSTYAEAPLSANQGRVLHNMIKRTRFCINPADMPTVGNTVTDKDLYNSNSYSAGNAVTGQYFLNIINSQNKFTWYIAVYNFDGASGILEMNPVAGITTQNGTTPSTTNRAEIACTYFDGTALRTLRIWTEDAGTGKFNFTLL